MTPEFLAESVSFLNLGVLGIVFLLFVAGKLHSETEYQQMLRDLDTERVAHERTREALRIANARSESGALAAEIVARALEGAHKPAGGDAHHAPALEP